MKKPGRHFDTALVRNSLNEKLLTFSHKRLIKDLEEIQNEKIPTVGVTARPLETDLFTWHANIRGPEKTPYEGGVFHLELKFPQSYPNHPPTIRIFNNIPHPNVFGGYICLDILQQYDSKVEEGSGWTSAYSVQSILTQLQSFLFEENLSADKAKVEMEIKKAVKDANSFKCPSCKHGGKLSLWPAFNSKENSIEEFETIEDENEIIRKELICFHTKLTYQQNQLGLGVNISKIPRTGLIKDGETFFDYISIKAFIKESRNLTSHNEKITHWLPVYFGSGDNEDRFFHLLKKAFSMIMTNSTKNFRP
jgi:ubiquitin-conjugating enzyme E2 A